MRNVLLTLGLVLGLSPAISAAPCISGTLDTYIGLGASGCTVGTITFQNFNVLTNGITGATAIAPNTITASPTGDTSMPGFSFQTNASASANQILQALFGYQVSGGSLTGATISLAGTGATRDGAATEIQDFCLNGSFSPGSVTGCSPGPSGNQLVLGSGSAQQAFSNVFSLAVVNDFTLDGGLSGSASGGVFTNQFAATPNAVIPEPRPYLLSAIGFIAIIFSLRRKTTNSYNS